ncbi:hypothetical protein H6A66_05930 [Bacteroides caecigallinarum]|uniref:hypothetical protein n=1 Tax=Bacteroides caecigallinarum TaxID=1411144 RepID=UPI00195E549A|nr:hypothetical protein [Bacteroides caecigallinarum]MBM6864708.1 hypothetical protein [Bacteroides caecigallinarum]
METLSKNIYVPPKCTVYELEIEGVICGSLGDEATNSVSGSDFLPASSHGGGTSVWD